MVAAWPAVALVGTYELLMLIIRRTGPAPAADRTPEPAPAAAPEAVTAAIHVPVDVPPAVPEPDPHQVRAVEHFAEMLADDTVPSVRTIRAELRVGQPRAQNIRRHLSELVAAKQNGGWARGR